MKIAALDLGDRWIGIATCDPLEIVASPYKTITADQLDQTIPELIEERVEMIVVGLPKTLGGKDSQQTLKIKKQFQTLQETYPEISWQLWDERLTSKQAETLKRPKNKQDKQATHAIAAALILGSYLDYRKFNQNDDLDA